ncbi:MAG: tetratricopeptide repeat protein [Opitutaceae bacterium]|nr:tetratricopeptide repeat protein [Opitutaceae bacterium]
MSEEKSAKNKMKGDDRNFVAVDEQYVTPGVEDRIYAFWEQNRKLILILIVAIILLIIGREVMGVLSSGRQQSIQDAYAEATTAEAKRSFAKKYRGHSLSGVALLTVADENYKAGEFTKAAADYEKAITQLEEKALGARGRLGQAISLIQSGVDSQGTSLLEDLAGDENLGVDTVRCEAYYHLSSLSREKGDIELARSYLNAVLELMPVGIWASRATSILKVLPASGESEE